MKIVERNGEQVQAIFTNANPWGKDICEWLDYVSCINSEKEKGRCRETNLVYETKCKLCKQKGETVTYVGETGRSMCERLSEHVKDNLGYIESVWIYNQNSLSDHRPISFTIAKNKTENGPGYWRFENDLLNQHSTW